MVKSNHRTLSTKFLDASNLKKLKNNLKSSGIQKKHLNHYLQTTYRIINDLESEQAEHRWNSKFVRPAHKDYVNTVEFVRYVAEIVSGHILNAICGGSESSPKAGDDDIAERLLKELSSLTGAADQGSSSHTHGDHIRSGVVNAVVEMLTTAKATGGLPGVMNAAKTTTLSSKAEADRRRRGAEAATLLASGKQNYNYCDTYASKARAKAAQNKQYERSKSVRRQSSNAGRTDAGAVGEKRTSTDGVKGVANSRSAIRAPVRPKPPDKSGNGNKEQRTSKTQNGSRTDQKQVTNGRIDRTNYGSKVVNSRKATDGGVKSGNGKNNVAIKTGDRMPRRQTATGDSAVNNTRSTRQSEGASGANSRLQKNTSRRKPSAVDGPDKPRRVRIENGSLTDQKRPTNSIRTSNAPKMTARKTVGEGVKSGNGKSGDNAVNNMRSQKQSDNRQAVGEGVKSVKSSDLNSGRLQKRRDVVRKTATKDDRKKSDDPVSAIGTDKSRKPGTIGARLKEVGGKSGTRGKTGASADVGGADDDKKRKLFNSNRNIPGADGAAEKSKTAGVRNTGSVGGKPKNGVSKQKRDETAISETLISPTIDYHDEASITAARDGTSEQVGTKITLPVGGAVDSARAPADVRGDDGGGGGGGGVGGGGKDAVPSEKLISPAIDYHDDASLTAARDGINEQVGTKITLPVGGAVDSARAPADVRGDDGGGGGGGGVGSGGKDAITRGDKGKDRMFDERDRTGPDTPETGCSTTKPTAADKAAGGRRTDNGCTDGYVYKRRMACVLGQLEQCQNKETGLYQAKRKGSKFEVTDLTKEEYCKLYK